jgi:uncharacterized Zn finger protein
MSAWYARPIFKPAGGLRLGRGEPARSWWGRRWLAALESVGWHTRLERGLAYARRGQVASIDVRPGVVFAQVQGGRPKPYDATITVHRFTKEGWARIAAELGAKAIFPAKLLAGDMPPELEDVFRRAGFPLFPTKGELASGCTCPDPESPCKHVAAAYYVFAHELDHDPFLLFRLRGMDRDELLAEIRKRRGRPPKRKLRTAENAEGRRKSQVASPPSSVSSAPSAADLSEFYKSPRPLPRFAPPRALPKPGSRVRELGVPPFWRGESDFVEVLADCSEAARRRAASLLGLD